MTDKDISTDLMKRLAAQYEKITRHAFEPAKKYDSGKVVYSVDQKPQGLFFVQSGRVKIVREGKHGEDTILRFVSEREFIGYVSLINKSEYTSTAITIEPSEILFIPRQVFLHLLQNDLIFTNKFINLICRQAEQSDEKIAGLMDMDALQRFAVLLLSLEMAYDEDDRYPNSYVRLPRKDIASAIGITPETISRFLSKLKKEKILKTTDGIIEILNRSALLRLSKVND